MQMKCKGINNLKRTFPPEMQVRHLVRNGRNLGELHANSCHQSQIQGYVIVIAPRRSDEIWTVFKDIIQEAHPVVNCHHY